jgi:hypothetical protein
VSTRKLVSSDAEQQVLESLIDAAKPPDPTAGRLHYLLATPFRYPPLRHGSRFGARSERGIWYGAEAPHGVSRRWRTTGCSSSRARAPNLTVPPFAAYHDTISSPTEYTQSQALGTSMRGAGVEVFRYRSARDPADGVNVGVLSPSAFGAAKPRLLETWHCTATRTRVELVKRDYFERRALAFPRQDFLVDGRLPAPAL